MAREVTTPPEAALCLIVLSEAQASQIDFMLPHAPLFWVVST